MGVPGIIIGLTLVTLAVSAVVLFFVVPPVIAQAYRGESLEILNGIIQGRAGQGLDRYLRAWHLVARRILLGELGLGFLLAIVAWPPLQRVVDARLGGLSARSDARAQFAMSRGRLAVATGVIVLLVGLQLFDIATQTEHWPFSPYPMYSGKQSGTLARIRIYGVTSHGELHLAPAQFLRPFDGSRLQRLFTGNGPERSDWRPTAERALRNVHDLYELGRKAGTHDGPSLRALRLYRVEWRIDPSLANKNTPEKRQLLYELPVAH